MRTLHHPDIEDIRTENILYALSDPIRAEIFARLAASEGTQICSKFLHLSDTPLPKSTLSQHFRVLREAGLIRSERRGVEMHNVTRCTELKNTFGPLLEAIIAAYTVQKKR